MGVDEWRLLSFEELFLRLDAQQDYMRDQAQHVAQIMWGEEEQSSAPASGASREVPEGMTDNDWYPHNN